MTQTEALRFALEALEADELAMIQDKDGHMVYLKDQAITAIKAALANEALERMAENARELGLDYQSMQKVTLGKNEALRVTTEGEFIWHQEADVMIEQGNFTSNPAMRHILRALRKPQRTWVSPSDKEIEAIWQVAMFANYGVGAELSNQPFVHYARAIEAKLKEKNT